MSLRFEVREQFVPEVGEFTFMPADRARLARYLELPSTNELDEITSAEIARLDCDRDGLLSFHHRVGALPIDRIDGASIELEDGFRLRTTAAYGRQLERNDADWLIIACLSLGGAVDARVQHHLAQGELFEAFVLKQWAATMTEQARAWLTLSLCAWADRQGRSLLPFSGPGYNGWPLEEMTRLAALLGGDDAKTNSSAIRVTESGLLLPINSMLIVHGAMPRRGALLGAASLAQCHRCAMRNCRYRVVSPDANEEPEIIGVAR